MVNGLFEDEAEAFEGAEAAVVAGAEGVEGAGVLTVEVLFFLGAIVNFSLRFRYGSAVVGVDFTDAGVDEG